MKRARSAVALKKDGAKSVIKSPSPKRTISDEEYERLRADVLEAAHGFMAARRSPFVNRTPAEQAASLEAQIAAMEAAVRLISIWKSEPGRHLPLKWDWPIVDRLQAKQMFREHLAPGICGGSLTALGAGGYPTQTVIGLETLLEDARAVLDEIRPGRGNAVDRAPSSVTKGDIAHYFVVRCLARFDALPPSSKASWADEMLSTIFQEIGLGATTGAHWIAREIQDLRTAHDNATILKRAKTTSKSSK